MIRDQYGNICHHRVFAPSGTGLIELNFSYGLVVSLPGTSVGTVEFPNQPFELPIPQSGIGLIDMPQGGNLRVSIPNVLSRGKIKVTVKSGDRARLFTETAAM